MSVTPTKPFVIRYKKLAKRKAMWVLFVIKRAVFIVLDIRPVLSVDLMSPPKNTIKGDTTMPEDEEFKVNIEDLQYLSTEELQALLEEVEESIKEREEN